MLPGTPEAWRAGPRPSGTAAEPGGREHGFAVLPRRPRPGSPTTACGRQGRRGRSVTLGSRAPPKPPGPAHGSRRWHRVTETERLPGSRAGTRRAQPLRAGRGLCLRGSPPRLVHAHAEPASPPGTGRHLCLPRVPCLGQRGDDGRGRVETRAVSTRDPSPPSGRYRRSVGPSQSFSTGRGPWPPGLETCLVSHQREGAAGIPWAETGHRRAPAAPRRPPADRAPVGGCARRVPRGPEGETGGAEGGAAVAGGPAT